jgi:hypothetical protein
MSENLGSNIPVIVLEEGAPAKPFEAKELAPVAAEVKEAYVRIVLGDSDEIPPTGQFFGLNGRGYILRPGEEADVPMGLIHILDNAVKEVPIVDNNTMKVVGWKKRLRFPYQIVRRDARAAA